MVWLQERQRAVRRAIPRTGASPRPLLEAVRYVAIDIESGALARLYTLSAADIPVIEAPPEPARKLPRSLTLPAARIGRLAADEDFRGQKLGSVPGYTTTTVSGRIWAIETRAEARGKLSSDL